MAAVRLASSASRLQVDLMQLLLFSSTTAFADATLNLDDDVADVLTATLFMHYPDMLVFCPSSPLITKIREFLALRAIGEPELLAWSVTTSQAFATPPESKASASGGEEPSPALIDLIKRQSEQIDQPPPIGATTTRPKKKGAQSLPAIWFEWFTAEPRVYVSRSVKKTALYEYRHIAGYLMLFLPEGFALDTSSPAYKSEVLELRDKAQQNALTFLKSHGSSAVAAGSALKALRQMQKLGKLDALIAQFHERVDHGIIPAVSLQPHSLILLLLLMLAPPAITPREAQPLGHHPARGRALTHVAALAVARVVALLLMLLASAAVTPREAKPLSHGHHPARGPAIVHVAALALARVALLLMLLASSSITPPEAEHLSISLPTPVLLSVLQAGGLLHALRCERMNERI
ncbi:hypothetical protein PHYSODRAFT_332725 [Phytophthora sojae]|uniref:Uncharacterized protein n=1 Tax=Phytophthora sojae (strain P6497) TaxID=1094619 RepID=G4ZDT1_PHYSP|nr:hypothetical protein PHYSODRAFT_332725 [Phytophthora sojae]EGZ19010.1 hypothetical protein PHYSODRAFT_332725 [Phytophthora sojae]|eukprot:XP_009528068.1 hypothetical protein PHYSODRAFT_332725 [Phytophthora sojae]